MSFKEGRCVYVTPKDALADIAYADWHNKFTPLGLKVGFFNMCYFLEFVLILLFSFFFVLVSIYHCIFFVILVIFILSQFFFDLMSQD